MRKRKWVLVLMLILIIANFGGYTLWKLSGTDERIRTLLLDKARPFLSTGSNIRELKITLSRIHLKGVTIVPKDRSFLLEIDDLQLGYNIFNLIRYRFNPNKVAHDVILVHPILLFTKQAFIRSPNHEGKNWSDYHSMVESFSTIKRITIAKAEIQVENSAGNRISLAQSLDGVLFTDPLDSASVRLTGNLFSSKKANVELSGRLNLISGALRYFKLKLEESDPSTNLASLIPAFAEVKRGKVRGECLFDLESGLRGYVEYSGGDFSLRKAPLRFEGTYLRGLFGKNGILFSGSVDRFNGSRLAIEGNIENFLDPRLDVKVHCPRFEVRQFFNGINPASNGVSAQAGQFELHITGSPNHPIVEGSVSAARLRGFGLSFDSLYASVQLNDSLLSLQADARNPDGLNMSAGADIGLKSAEHPSRISAALSGDARMSLPGFFQNRYKAVSCDAGLKMEGPFKTLHGEASAKLSAIPTEGRPLDIFSNFFYNDRKCLMSIRSAEGFRVTGEILNPLRSDARWNIQSSGIQGLFQEILRGIWPKTYGNVEINGRSFGNPAAWTVELNGSDSERTSFPQVFQLKAESRKKDSARRQLNLSGSYFGPEGDVLPLSIPCVFTDEGILVQKAEVGDFLAGSIRIPQSGTLNKWDGILRVNNAGIEKLHRFFPELKPFAGRWNGELRLQGPRDNPAYRLDLSLRNGVFHDVGIFEGDFSAGWQRGHFDLFDISILKNGLPLLVGTLRTSKEDSLKGEIQSGTLNLDELVCAMTGKKELVRGEATIKVRAEGTGVQPVLSASVDIGEGAIKSISFRKFHVMLADTLFKEKNPRNGMFCIREGYYGREDGFEVHFNGKIPHDRSQSMNVVLSGKGNILGFLPEVDGFFTQAESSGEFYLRLAGGPGQPVAKNGWLRLDDGKMRFSSTLDPIEKIKGEARLLDGDSLLQITRLTGTIRDGNFTIKSRRPEMQDGDFRPIYFNRPKINLGILSLSTGSKGIPLHLPGLMAEKEQGWIAFSGLKKGNEFTITGPVDSPGLSGTLLVSDNQLTYPFLTVGKRSAKSGIERLLEKIRWNLRVVPQKSVHYIRDIQSAAGNIYVDLQLQDGYGALDIAGCLNDDSFQVWGNLVSVEGNIEVLDRYFRPERIIFDYPRGGSPIFSGRAYTTVVDSMGVSSTVWLNLVSVDEETGLEEKGGPWSRVQFRFSTDNPNLGRNEADLLAAIGYSESNMKNRAYDALGMQVENVLFRPIIRPLERGLRKYLGFDMVKFSSMFSRNLFEQQSSATPIFDPKSLLRSSKLTLGKSFAPGFMLLYTGEVQNDFRYVYPMHGIGLRHAVALEYAINPELMLELEYTYDSQLLYQRREDKRIWLKHVFPF
jgi:hypothetical protein